MLGHLFGSTAFLIGPKRQLDMMLDSVRIYATALYIASIIIALFCTLYVSKMIILTQVAGICYNLFLSMQIIIK
jgi:hypothetical protein